MPTMTAGTCVFDPTTTPTLAMGIVAETFWRQAGVLRSDHPGASFAARGPEALKICKPQPLSPPHGLDSPVGRVYEAGGQVLLLGVGYGECTMMHLAEALAQVPYSISHPCVVGTVGQSSTVMIPETDHCCENFSLVEASLVASGQQTKGVVGHAQAKLVDAEAVIAAACAMLARDPLVYLCAPSQGCLECDVARASVDR